MTCPCGHHDDSHDMRAMDDSCEECPNGRCTDAIPCALGVDGSECAMVRERSVAGISNDIPACPVHGEHPDTVEA